MSTTSEHKNMLPLILVFMAGLIIVATIFIIYNSAKPKTVAEQIVVDQIIINNDQDNDDVLDLQDIVEGARKEVNNKTKHQWEYYEGGYPPDNEGACTDVIWRALKNAGYNLKELIDTDIAENTKLYPMVMQNGKPDPNIDFRTLENLEVFFNRFAVGLTTELIPGDPESLKHWQGGDIVVFIEPYHHIGIVSDTRRNDGVPLVIHNIGPSAKEMDFMTRRDVVINYHFRFPKDK